MRASNPPFGNLRRSLIAISAASVMALTASCSTPSSNDAASEPQQQQTTSSEDDQIAENTGQTDGATNTPGATDPAPSEAAPTGEEPSNEAENAEGEGEPSEYDARFDQPSHFPSSSGEKEVFIASGIYEGYSIKYEYFIHEPYVTNIQMKEGVRLGESSLLLDGLWELTVTNTTPGEREIRFGAVAGATVYYEYPADSPICELNVYDSPVELDSGNCGWPLNRIDYGQFAGGNDVVMAPQIPFYAHSGNPPLLTSRHWVDVPEESVTDYAYHFSYPIGAWIEVEAPNSHLRLENPGCGDGEAGSTIPLEAFGESTRCD